MLAAKNPMTRVQMVTLLFEALIALLAIAGMVQVEAHSVALAVGSTVVVAVVALAAAALLRGPVGWVLGWITQVALIGLGFLTSWMFWLGGIFALLWVVGYVLGRRLVPASAEPASR
ncbi:MAG: DUF4233 domain-containing protein [Propionicimonas sp.]|uniref:DUF4233 domain-containing protein n=1 Tax=Propionicimonas sp. TaxID=1955623 RepID=UPI002B1FCFB1|nr:DUF4233 domain-containing protein [Propionicimonas sp.]MEA4943726.1 DUF4233 domain-containing protein [Propionicimonas sp.]